MNMPGEEHFLNQNIDSIPYDSSIGNDPSGNWETLNDLVEDNSSNEGTGIPQDGNVSHGDVLDDVTYDPGLRRSTRNNCGTAPQRFRYFCAFIVMYFVMNADSLILPTAYNEAIYSTERDNWTKSMK